MAVVSSHPNNQSPHLPLRRLPSSEDKEHELEVLRRRVSALEEYIATSTAAGSIADSAKEISRAQAKQVDQQNEPATENSGVQDRPDPQHYARLSDVAKELSSTHDKQLTLNKSRLYGPSHWTQGGNEVSKYLGSRPSSWYNLLSAEVQKSFCVK